MLADRDWRGGSGLSDAEQRIGPWCRAPSEARSASLLDGMERRFVAVVGSQLQRNLPCFAVIAWLLALVI